jgi:streptogramin lyase
MRTNIHCIVLWAAAAGILGMAGRAAAEPTIATVAGSGQPGNNGDAGAALKINIGDPFGVEFGPDGGLYITEVRHHRLRRLDPKTGELSTVAGTGKIGYSGDGGSATEAALNEPYEVRFDAEGNIFFVEMKNHLIRRVDAKTGVISTIAGTGEEGFGGDGGPAIKAQFRQPHSIALDDHGRMFVADIGNHRIRVIDLKAGTIDTFAGNGERQLPVAGQPAHGRPVLGPRALYIRDNILWLALREGHSVWKLDLAQGREAVWQHVAGTGKKGYSGDGGPATKATFDGPKGIVVNAEGMVDVVDTENQAIRRIDTKTGRISTLAGMGPQAKGYGGDDGPATAAKLDRPHGICHGPDGAVYIGDTLNHRVRRISP